MWIDKSEGDIEPKNHGRTCNCSKLLREDGLMKKSAILAFGTMRQLCFVTFQGLEALGVS
jgi:hypothetical protein